MIALNVSAPNVIYAMLSDPGRVRRGNEDACAASVETGAFIVCDGMGGAADGEVASHLAVETFLACLEKEPRSGDRHSRPQLRLYAAIQAANEAVYNHSRQSPHLSGMGTTLVALLHAPIARTDSGRHLKANSRSTDPASLWLGHVGDSRCYRLRGTELQQLTDDHSLVEEQVRAGQLTPEQAATSPMRNLITRAVGSQPQVEPDIHTHRHRPGDLYLLASDGLTRELSDQEIADILATIPNHASQTDLDAACHALVDAANHSGGRDNITVLLVSFPVTR